MGVGARVTRSSWDPYGNSYWEVTAVKPRGEVSLFCAGGLSAPPSSAAAKRPDPTIRAPTHQKQQQTPQDGAAGKAWGVRVWRGVREEGRDGGGGGGGGSKGVAAGAAAAAAEAAAAAANRAAAAAAAAPGPAAGRRIPGRAKRVWRWQPTDEELARLAPLLQEARRREAAAAAAGAAASES
jgi:hypothetical protein